MKIRDWNDFTNEERQRIYNDYHELNTLALEIERKLPTFYALDPRGAKLILGRIEETIAKVKAKMEG